MNETSNPTPADLHSGIAGKADSIYFLMYNGWKEELRSNRWHYATRWARHLPVILVQPNLTTDDAPSVSEPELRFPNCRILHVREAAPPATTLACSLIQARQILADMKAHGHRKPILWAYYPDYLFAHAVIPAVARVYHGSENYFSFDGLSVSYLNRLKSMLATSDLVVAVSDGVADAYRPYVHNRIEVATNGCDYKDYSRGGIDPELAAARVGWNKLVVYAGNLNLRIDIDLLEKCVRECPDMLFAFFGPAAWDTQAETAQWEALIQRPNARYFGAVGIERLPPIFGTGDVGLIPYRSTPLVIGNLFPLKAFEMQATGLPVVSTYMTALAPFAGPGLRIATDADEFVSAIRSTSRAALSAADRAAIDAASRAQDYDRKFERVLGFMGEVLAARPQARAPAAELFGLQDEPEVWDAAVEDMLAQLLSARRLVLDEFRSETARWLIPYRDIAHRFLPAPLRQRIRRFWPS